MFWQANLISSLAIDIEWLGNTDKYILWLRGIDISEGRKHVLMFKVHGNHALCSPVLVQLNNGPFASHIHCSVMPIVLVLLESKDES